MKTVARRPPRPCVEPGCPGLTRGVLCSTHEAQRAAELWPADLGRSAVPLTIVCGPPGSGKTTYALRRAERGHVVIDLDAIRARLSGAPWYRSGPEWIGPALRERNRLLRALASPPADVVAAWFIVAAPEAERRAWWAGVLGAQEVVVLEVPIDICIGRIKRDERRSDMVGTFVDAVRSWWRDYTPRDGETVVRAGGGGVKSLRERAP